ncbi:MAG: DUF2169 domain-containing protein [Byssovorax sp.]
MSFSNATRFAALDVPMPDHEGRPVVVAIVKATFTVLASGRLVPADEQRPVRINDELYDPDSPESSVRLPTDICVVKQGTDLIVVGEAISPRPVEVMDVAVRARDVTVPVRVHGERVFYQGLLDVQIGPAAPFERKPIVYEKAYGGVGDDPWTIESRNRAGVGVAKRKRDLIGKPAPQIEHPARPHKTADDDHPPWGLGAIRSHWSPRLERAGTFDDVWEKTRMPAMPADFDIRANNLAHPALLFEQPLAPGDEIAIAGMSTRGALSFTLPDLGLVFRARSDVSGRIEVPPVIDTVLIEPEARVIEVIARRAFPQGRGKDVLRELAVDTA